MTLIIYRLVGVKEYIDVVRVDRFSDRIQYKTEYDGPTTTVYFSDTSKIVISYGNFHEPIIGKL